MKANSMTSEKDYAMISRWINKPLRNRRKKSRKTGVYQMLSLVRGWCLIFSNHVFHKLPKLMGYESDKTHFRKVFTALHFKCQVFEKVTTEQIKNTIRAYANKPASDENHPTNALVVVILTHGDENNVLYGYNFDPYSKSEVKDVTNMKDILDIVSNQNCEHLRQKPKLFFVQACRGGKSDKGLELCSKTEPETTETDACAALPNLRSGKFKKQLEEEAIHNLPSITEDTMVCYATTPDYKSYVYPDNRGSVFGAHVCVALKKWSCTQHIQRILNGVTDQMSKKDVLVKDGFIKQTMHIEIYGWKKELDFNPGLFKKHTPVQVDQSPTTTTIAIAANSSSTSTLTPQKLTEQLDREAIPEVATPKRNTTSRLPMLVPTNQPLISDCFKKLSEISAPSCSIYTERFDL